MPRYYLIIHNGAGTTDDHDGMELADLDAARDQARRGARSIISSEALEGVVDLRGRIEILAEDRALVETLHFRDVVRLMA